jgi:S-formylglutathione hydrolase
LNFAPPTCKLHREHYDIEFYSFPLEGAVADAGGGRDGGRADRNSREDQGSRTLEGNLEGDPAERDVCVYLPPSYATQPNRRYPVVYFIHGYGATAEAYWKLMTVPATADKLMNSGTVHEMILVHPDAHTLYAGSMYSDSPTTGNGEDYITHDLVAYIDSHYRTITTPESRGLAGHSMGGYGTLRLAMKYPGIFPVSTP